LSKRERGYMEHARQRRSWRLMWLCMAVALSGSVVIADGAPVSTPFVFTNRVGETISFDAFFMTNQMVVATLASGAVRSLPLAVFPGTEQTRMKMILGIAPVPGCLVPAWRLYDGQLGAARDASTTRAASGFVVRQIKEHERVGTLSDAEAKYWIAHAVEKEQVVRQALPEQNAVSGAVEKKAKLKGKEGDDEK